VTIASNTYRDGCQYKRTQLSWIYSFTYCVIVERRCECCCALLDAGALVDATTEFGSTPLYYAIYSKHVEIARLLIVQGGAKVSKLVLDKDVPAIPDWVTTFKCQTAALVVIGIHKYHRSNVTGNNDINVLRLISKHIWSTRMDGAWVTPIVVEKKESDEIQINVANIRVDN
jgi:hypothetical protein